MHNRKKAEASSQEPKIEFPAEDQHWFALQQRVIELAKKPIEDLSYRELQEVRLDLSDAEVATLNEYLRGRRLESSNAFDGIVGCRPWTQKLCSQTLEDLIDFQDYLRCVACRLFLMTDSEQLDAIEKDLLSFLEGFPGAEVKPDDGTSWSQSCRVLRNIGRVPPTDKGIAFMEGLYEKLQSREAEKQKQEEDKRSKKAAELKKIQESGKHVFDIHVGHVRAHFYISYDVIAQTKETAYQDAIRRFDADYPNARKNNWPIWVRAYFVDDVCTRDLSATDVPWDSELVKSINWERSCESRHSGTSTQKEEPAN